MHVEDGFICNSQLIVYTIITIILLIYMAYRNRNKLTTKQIPLIAMFIAVTVMVQYFDIPLPVPACAHLTLIAIIALYDPWVATIVYSFVTVIQAFYGEGGITAIGVNLLNLAIMAPWLAQGFYKLSYKIGQNQQWALFMSGFLTLTGLGFIVSVEYAIAGTYPLSYGLIFITGVEAVVGILEGIVTVAVMNLLRTRKPELVPIFNEDTIDKN